MNPCESVLYPSPVLAFGFQWLNKRHLVSGYTVIYRDSDLVWCSLTEMMASVVVSENLSQI